MVQVQKPKMRDALVSAALEEFSRAGFEGATLANIAKRASTSIGNLYKYFPSKDALFDAALPRELVDELRALVRARVEALGAAIDIEDPRISGLYREASERLLDFTLQHRTELLFLLTHAEGTPHAAFFDNLVSDLVKLATAYAKRAYPRFSMTPSRRRALRRIYTAFVMSLSNILSEEQRKGALREAVTLHATYHLPGLAAFFEAGSRT